MAKKLTQRLLDLGASLFHLVGLGDYQHDFAYEGEFDPWMKQLWLKLANLLPDSKASNARITPEEKHLFEPIYEVQVGEEIAEDK